MLIYTMPPPSLVADAGGRVYAAWYDARNGDWDVFLRRSLDGGRTWDPAVRLNDDPLHDGSHQYLPRLSVADNGRIDAVFYDRRGNKENRGNDVYYTSSTDHGATFTPNVKVTTLDSDSKIGPRYDVPSAAGLNEFGSRIALLSEPSSVLAAWTDTRNTGRAFPAQDIFAASLRLGGSDEGQAWVPGVIVAVALLALASALVIVRRRRRSRPHGVGAVSASGPES